MSWIGLIPSLGFMGISITWCYGDHSDSNSIGVTLLFCATGDHNPTKNRFGILTVYQNPLIASTLISIQCLLMLVMKIK